VEAETKEFYVDLTDPANLPDLSSLTWRKSSRSGPNCDNCVEVAFTDQAVAVRDSKNPTRAALVFAPAQWRAFISDTREGRFDLD